MDDGVEDGDRTVAGARGGAGSTPQKKLLDVLRCAALQVRKRESTPFLFGSLHFNQRTRTQRVWMQNFCWEPPRSQVKSVSPSHFALGSNRRAEPATNGLPDEDIHIGYGIRGWPLTRAVVGE